jgi:pantetheine-phosphate adenylyltransferase
MSSPSSSSPFGQPSSHSETRTTVSPSHAVYVGSFDPMTLGHLDIVRRATRVFQKVTVGIGINPDKSTLFSPEERVQLCQQAMLGLTSVEVRTFSGLAVDFVRDCGSRILLRGVRSLTDIDAEFTMSLTNRVLDQEIESIFLMSAERYAHISSSLIKQIATMARGNATLKLKEFVPSEIIAPLIQRLRCESPPVGH